jgi:hypothetical protein
MTGTPLPFQPPLPPGPPPAHAANLRLLKDQEDLPSDLEALLKEQQEAAAAAEGGAGSAAAPPPVPVPAHLQAVGDAQWIECDVRALDYSLLGKFGVVMVDPPWEEVNRNPYPETPYGDVMGFRVGDRSRRRFATPADFLVRDCSPDRGLHVRRESVGFVHRSRSIFCRPVPP